MLIFILFFLVFSLLEKNIFVCELKMLDFYIVKRASSLKHSKMINLAWKQSMMIEF